MDRFEAIMDEMQTGSEPQSPFKRGDLVTTPLCGFTRHVVRKVTKVVYDRTCSTGFMVYADAGHHCPQCSDAGGDEIDGADASWFEPVSDGLCISCRI